MNYLAICPGIKIYYRDLANFAGRNRFFIDFNQEILDASYLSL